MKKLGSRWHLYGALAVIAACFLGMLAMSWFRWPAAIIDFGEEVYVPWRMVEGEALYEDIEFSRGPLSPSVNAWLFRVFGVGIAQIATANIAVIAVICVSIFILFRAVSGLVIATLACITFIMMFAFAEYIWQGNYDFVAPYSHEQTHIHFLTFLGLLVLRRFLRKESWPACMLLGLLGGLAFLSKVELFLCYLGAIGTAIVWQVFRSKPGILRASMWITAFLAGLVLTPTAFAALDGSFNSVFRAWTEFAAIGETVVAGSFSQSVLGFDDISGNAATLLMQTGAYALGLIVALVVSYVLYPWHESRWVAGALLVTVAYLLCVPLYAPHWLFALRPLPLLALTFTVLMAADLWRNRSDRDHAIAHLPLLCLGIYAVLLLARMPLRAQIWHYGFSLAMPSTLVSIELVRRWALGLARRLSGNTRLFGSMALGVVLAFWIVHARLAWRVYQDKDTWVASSFRTTNGRLANSMNATLNWINANTSKSSTFVALPEGVMLNFLTRRENPTRYMTFNPLAFDIFGEEKVIAAMKQSTPDYILLVERDNSEHGARYFGRDYAHRTMQWVNENYTEIVTFGEPPLTGKGFGIRILGRAR